MSTGFTEDQEIVLDIIKEWLREYDANFIAREEQIVFWGPIDGNIRKQGWNKLKLKEAVSVVRSTKVPVGLMKHCTEDAVRAAAQEEGRAFIAGVTVIGEVAPEYFNFHTNKRSVCETVEHKIAQYIIAELEALDENVMWRDLAYIYEQALKYCGLQVPTSHARNGFLRYALQNSTFVEKRNNKSYNGRYVYRENGKLIQAICIKLPHKSKVKTDWTKDMMRGVILRAVKHLRK